MTIREQIENSEIFLSGAAFRPIEMARHLGLKSSEVGNILVHMRGSNHCGYDGVHYWRHQRHWIHDAPLNDARALRAARNRLSGNPE